MAPHHDKQYFCLASHIGRGSILLLITNMKKSQEIKIREVQERDYGTLVVLLKQLGYGGNDVVSVANRVALIKAHGGVIFVVEDDGANVVGFAALTFMPLMHCDGLLARIAAICVDESTRSAGVGGALIRFIENYSMQKGCVILEVTTNLVRLKAHQFYMNNGFAETHKRYSKKLEAWENWKIKGSSLL